MIEQQYFRLTFVIVICISILSEILSYFQIPYQFYVWELFIDSKIIALMLLLIFLYRKKAIQLASVKLLLMSWSWKKNIIYFFLPIFIYVIVIAAGLLFNAVLPNKLDNSTTLILATLFDIPAIFVFSATSILIEEIFFRGFLLSTMQQFRPQWQAIILISFAWVVYNFSEIIGIEDVNLLQSIIVVLFYFSIGLFCSILVSKYKSIWLGYSLRVGLITLTPIIVTSLLSESDAFFSTESVLFIAEGAIVSVLIMVIGYILFRSVSGDKKIIKEKVEKLNFP
jgi:membrane protease YdiL (CAAX protease family)